jgi:hypothetical protein
MSNRRVEVKRIATSKPGTFLDVAVSYDDARNDFMGYGSRQRGYYLTVGVIRDDGDGFIKYLIGHGGKGLLELATRYSEKRLKQLAAAAEGHNEPLDQIVHMVLDKNGFTLATPAEPATAPVAAKEVSLAGV